MIPLILCSLLVVSGCIDEREDRAADGRLTVVTSFYPLYDFAERIGGDRVHVINLIPTGVDAHDWTPKTNDIRNITDAHLFIYNGLGFEGWVDRFLVEFQESTYPVVIQASSGIEPIRRTADHEAGREPGEHEAGHDHPSGDHDPHVWLSPLQAIKMAENIKEGLVLADAANRSEYESRFEALRQDLEELHRLFEETVAGSPRRDIVVSHQAYAYLVRDYGLKQIPVMGISPDSEPTARDLKEVMDYIEQHDVKYILFEELASPKLAEMLAQDAGVQTLVFNPVEGLTEQQERAGESYVSLMTKNAEVLKKALNDE